VSDREFVARRVSRLLTARSTGALFYSERRYSRYFVRDNGGQEARTQADQAGAWTAVNMQRHGLDVEIQRWRPRDAAVVWVYRPVRSTLDRTAN